MIFDRGSNQIKDSINIPVEIDSFKRQNDWLGRVARFAKFLRICMAGAVFD